jgi:transposase
MRDERPGDGASDCGFKLNGTGTPPTKFRGVR